MGINDLLPHLPGGKSFRHSFCGLGWTGLVVPIDAASALFGFAAYMAADFLRGNHIPALIQWAMLPTYLHSICGWNMIVQMNGIKNEDKEPENQRRSDSLLVAIERNNLRGKIKNYPDYIAKAIAVCKFLCIEVHASAYKADPRVSYVSLERSLILVTSNSDLLAYGVHALTIVKGYHCEWYRVIDLSVDAEEGKYSLFDLYNKYGPIVFHLYDAYR